MKFARMLLPGRGWEKSLRNSFAVFKVCLCRRGELVFVVSVFYYVSCFLQLFSTALDLFWVN